MPRAQLDLEAVIGSFAAGGVRPIHVSGEFWDRLAEVAEQLGIPTMELVSRCLLFGVQYPHEVMSVDVFDSGVGPPG